MIYQNLDNVPKHEPFMCKIHGDTYEFMLSYDDPEQYNYLDDPAGNSYITKEYLIECGPFWVDFHPASD